MAEVFGVFRHLHTAYFSYAKHNFRKRIASVNDAAVLKELYVELLHSNFSEPALYIVAKRIMEVDPEGGDFRTDPLVLAT